MMMNPIIVVSGETEEALDAVPIETEVVTQGRAVELRTETEMVTGDLALELAIQGEHLCNEGRWEEGISCLEEALSASPTDPVALSALYSQLGNAYFYVKRYEQALDVYSQALSNAHRSGQRREEAQAAANMTNTLRFMGSYHYAAEFGQLYLNLCRELADVEGESHALYTLGSVYHAIGKKEMRQGEARAGETLRRAVQYYKEHLDIVTKAGDVRSQGRVCGSLGSIHCLQGEYQVAVEYYAQRLQTDIQLGDADTLRKTYVNLANTHLCLRQYSKAVEYYEQSMLLAQQLKSKPLEAQACFSLANTYSLAGDHVTAAKYLNKHLWFAEDLGDLVGAARSCWCLGNSYTEMEQHDKAYSFAYKHLELSMQLGDSAGVSLARKNLADLMTVMKSRSKKCSEEKNSFFNNLFGKRKGHAASLEPPRTHTRLCRHTHSFNRGETGRGSLRKMKLSSSDTTLLCDPSETDLVHPKQSMPVINCTAGREEEEGEAVRDKGQHSSIAGARPLSSHEEGKEGMDDRLLDLIVECQGRRMDDQRSSAVPPVEGVEAAKVLDRRSVAGEGSPRAPEEGERAQAVRQRQPVRVDEGRRRVSNGSLGSLDDLFFDTLMSAQNSRLEDQRSPDPLFERSQTLPGEDFLNLLLQLQSRRMEDQRSPFPNPFL